MASHPALLAQSGTGYVELESRIEIQQSVSSCVWLCNCRYGDCKQGGLRCAPPPAGTYWCQFGSGCLFLLAGRIWYKYDDDFLHCLATSLGCTMAPADQRWLGGLDLLQHACIFVPAVSNHLSVPIVPSLVLTALWALWACGQRIVRWCEQWVRSWWQKRTAAAHGGAANERGPLIGRPSV